MFYKKNSDHYLNPVDGIRLKTLTYGEKVSLTEFVMEKGNDLPAHEHPHEQIGYLVSGRIKLTVEDQVYETGPGDSWCIPGGVKHSATIIEDSIAIEIFSPVREDYLP
ncbi:cupin domain-containing protein [bacterium]|nr:cupin domain-containing protein [bacterium]